MAGIMKRMILSTSVLFGAAAFGDVCFTLPFDGDATAKTPTGTVKPIKEGKIEYGPGRTGQAAHFPYGKETPLQFAAKDILKFEEGTVTFWFKPDPVKGDDEYGNEDAYCRPWAEFFTTQVPEGDRHGTGQLWFWHNYYGHVRADRSDDIDCYNVNAQRLIPGEWNHLAYTWDSVKAQVSVNGHVERTRRNLRYIKTALKKGRPIIPGKLTFSRREDFKMFEIGGGKKPAGGWLDDLEIRNRALTPEEITALAGGEKPNIVPPADWLKKPNPYLTAPKEPAGVPGRMELLDRVTFDSPAVIENLKKNERWSLVGPTDFKELNGTKYLALGTNREDRCAVRFKLDGKGVLYCFEIDYPDDMQRTIDFTVQVTKNKRQYPVPLAFHGGLNTYDYAMQVGVLGGDEYRLSNKILTHRCIYWAADTDVTLLAVTARAGQGGAAMSEVRVYRIVDNALPTAKINPPAKNADGWNRSFGTWFEDPAIHYDFASEGYTLEKMMTQVERTCAWMKYTGYDIFAYPFSWYSGVCGYEGQCARGMPLGIEQLYYARFDAEGLGIMPTMNLCRYRMGDTFGGLTKDYITDGSAYGSPLTIADDGKVFTGRRGRHDYFNFSHPESQEVIERYFDVLVAAGKDHPSFRGIGIFMHTYNVFTFINEKLGYNDYTVEAFAKEKGLKIPIDRKDPLRGKTSAAWIKANAWDAWLDWRCEVVARFYKRLAAKLAAVRPDAKLVLNSWIIPTCRNQDEKNPGFTLRRNRLAGFNPALFADTPNIVAAQTITPSDYRHRDKGVFSNMPFDPVLRAVDRTRYLKPDDYEISQKSNYPWVHQHERYWEDWEGLKSICAKTNSLALNCNWLDESIWRVSVINPVGRHALRFFAVPLGHCDLMAMTKGGYLVGTYGTEDVFVPFVQAFRALPAVKMADVKGGPEGIVLRHVDFDGKSYFYLLNVTDEPRTVTVELPRGTKNLVTGENPVGWLGGLFGPKRVEIRLDSYELKSFSAPKGTPGW